jgi:hypothetical protein
MTLKVTSASATAGFNLIHLIFVDTFHLTALIYRHEFPSLKSYDLAWLKEVKHAYT